jgi:hypothetical protein
LRKPSRQPGRTIRRVLIGAASLLTVGCASSYQPRADARVGVVIRHGSIAYTKSGRVSPVGPFGGDLEGLVADAPAATPPARRARHQLEAGVPMYVGGLAGVVVGLLALSGPVGWIVIGVGAATGGTGLCLMGAGVTNGIDAVNIHNDAVLHNDAVSASKTASPTR